MTEQITLPRSVLEQALSNLDELKDDAAAYIYPTDLQKCMTSECVVEVRSFGYGGWEVPLFSREQVEEAIRAALAAQQAEPVATYMGHRLTPDGTKEFWGLADAPLEPGTKLYTAPQPSQTVAVPQGWRELMREARDNCEASIAEDGVSAMRREYRKELLARIDAMLAAPTPPGAAAPVPEMHNAMCPALGGGRCTCSESPVSVDKAWARFCGKIGRGKDAPYPGMIEAFEAHYGQSFCDKDWRTETGVWAAAWKAAMLAAAPTPPGAATPVLEPLTIEQINELPEVNGVKWPAGLVGPIMRVIRAIEAAHNAKLAKRGEV